MISANDEIGLYAQAACLWEVTARKPGNVHRQRDFSDTTYLDFALSAAALGSALDGGAHEDVGLLVERCIRQTRKVTRANTNLGISLLLAPLVKALPHPDYQANVERVLAGLTVGDSIAVYSAIRLARPGGLGRVAEGDVSEQPERPLRELMALAADRDLIARQYANGFREVFSEGARQILAGIERTGCLEGGIIHAHLHLMAQYPDSLIARKRGLAVAREAGERARRVLALGWPGASVGREAISELDDWLRAEGNARNPGTTADLIAASLFVLLRTRRISLPLELIWGLETVP